MNDRIETYKGRVPRCRHCNKPLRPQYETVSEDYTTGASGWRWAKAHELTAEDLDKQFPDRSDGTEVFDSSHGSQGRTYVWKESLKTWAYRERSYKVKSRKFLGTFGRDGNGFFCSLECGYRYGIAVCKRSAT